MNLNEIKHGFKLVKVTQLDDVSSTLYEFEHLKSKGKVAYVKCDDTNCCFAIGFRTLPKDSTGVCHIIEHSLLCGSKKYPLKEPFVNLLKSSLQTFLNAFTAYDWTMYPFASQTPKDFDNILKIYCDAVFNPLSMVDPKPFLQEGWHLELLNEEDTPSYKGVVYNEMIGAMSSVDSVLTQSTLEAMYKDSFYRFNSGGEPRDIINLSYEDYKSFYREHYTPQNAMTFFYGKMDIEEKLKFLDEEYFSHYEPKEEIVITPQKPLIDTSYETEYEIGAEEDEKDNTYISLCYGLDHYKNFEGYLAMRILCDALLSQNDSILKKALLSASLGQDVVYSIDDDNIVPALHIYLQKTNPSKKMQFKKVFEDEVRKLVENGIDKELLLASINHFEFKDKEFATGSYPKGLIFAMDMMCCFNYNIELNNRLEFNKYYQKFKKELNGNYFENVLKKYILESKHNVLVMVKPSKTLGERKRQEMAAKMQHLKETLTVQEKKALVKQTKELLEYQNHVDTPKELKTLPTLKIKDIPTTINYLDSKKVKVKGLTGITHTLNTNSIAYFRMYFSLKKVKFEDLCYVTLLRSLLLNVDTKKYNVSKLNNVIKTYLGDLSFAQTLTSTSDKDYNYMFKVTASALKENANYIPEVLNEVLLHSKFSKKEVLQIVKQITNGVKQSIIERGNSIAANMAASTFSEEACINVNSMMGPKVYKFFDSLANHYDHAQVSAKLKELVKLIFNKNNAFISLSGDEDTLKSLTEAVRLIKLPNKKYEDILTVKLASKSNNAIIIPSGVSYNALAYNINLLEQSYSGKYNVLAQILNYDYLWTEVRVKGGAYGCGLRAARNGDLVFATYRDPNVKNSYEVFNNVVNYLKNFEPSKDLFASYIVGTMSNFDLPLSNPSFIDYWDRNYMNKISKKDLMNRKKEILTTKREDIKAFATLFEKILPNAVQYTVGEESKIKEYTFDKIDSL